MGIKVITCNPNVWGTGSKIVDSSYAILKKVYLELKIKSGNSKPGAVKIVQWRKCLPLEPGELSSVSGVSRQ